MLSASSRSDEIKKIERRIRFPGAPFSFVNSYEKSNSPEPLGASQLEGARRAWPGTLATMLGPEERCGRPECQSSAPVCGWLVLVPFVPIGVRRNSNMTWSIGFGSREEQKDYYAGAQVSTNLPAAPQEGSSQIKVLLTNEKARDRLWMTSRAEISLVAAKRRSSPGSAPA